MDDRNHFAETLIGERVGRVRVEQLLGKGGMGAVYRGFDEGLERPVALKLLRQDRQSLRADQLLREARMLSKFDHPNVCRIYDLISDSRGDFLVLELVEGTTLRQAMESEMPWGEKLRIGEQIAGALAAAHAQQIVHRDLKPENVMISADGRVKVLDFGIARLTQKDGDETKPRSMVLGEGRSRGAPVITGEATDEVIVGTLRYMSPEQVRGESVTEASDLYSLGILLFRLFMGRSAYPKRLTGIQLVASVSKADIEPLEGLDGEVARLIGALTRLEPENRPRAHLAVETLRRVRERPMRRRRFFLAGFFVAALVLATAFFSVFLTNPSPVLGKDARGRIAILPFDNQTGSQAMDWIHYGLASMVAKALDSAPGIEVIELEEIEHLCRQLNIVPRVSTASVRDLERLAQSVGAEVVVASVVERDNDVYRLRYALYSIYGSMGIKEAEAPELTQLANNLRERLAKRLRPEGLWSDLKDTFSDDEFANRAYAMGVQRLMTAGTEAAEPYFRVCLDRDKRFLRAKMELARCQHKAGRIEAAQSKLNDVLEASRLRLDQQLEAECLVVLAAQNLESSQLVIAQDLLSQAFMIQEQIGDLTGLAKTMERRATIAYHQGDVSRAVKQWRQALTLVRKAGDRRLEGDILRNLGYGEIRLGKHDEARRRFGQSLKLFQDVGDREGELGALGSLGYLLTESGRFEEAEEFFKRTHRLAVVLGNAKSELVSLSNLGSTNFNLGKLDEAERYTRKALEIGYQTNNRRTIGQNLSALGYYAAKQGRLDEAETLLEQAASVADDIKEPSVSAQVERNQVYLYVRQGRLDEAGRLMKEAMVDRNDKLSLVALARYYYAVGSLEKAVAVLEDAKNAAGIGWNKADQQRLETFREARRVKEILPLPDESSP